MNEQSARRVFLHFIGAAILSSSTSSADAFENRIGEMNPLLKGVPYGANTPQPRMVGGVGELSASMVCVPSEQKWDQHITFMYLFRYNH